MVTSRAVALLGLALCGTALSREAASPAACLAAAQQPPIAAAKAELTANAADLPARLRLADAWSDAGCFNDALQTLQVAEAAHPHDKELRTRIEVAKSSVSEQTYFDSMDSAAKDARLSRANFRCSKLSELASCDEALSLKPNDAAMLFAKADTLVLLKRPAEAIDAYRRIPATSGNRVAVTAKIASAESQRRSFANSCVNNVGDAALHACEAALLPGEPDEEAILKRRGFLLQADNRLAPALDAYIAAARVQAGDHSVALSIINLSDSTARSDAFTLTARGQAFITLGRPAEAVEPLRAALRLAPDLPEARMLLRTAERSTRVERPQRLAEERAGVTGSRTAVHAAAAPKTAVGEAAVGEAAVGEAAVGAGETASARYSNDAAATQSN
jgi:tetratricopeptide (TPR) repeat protein